MTKHYIYSLIRLGVATVFFLASQSDTLARDIPYFVSIKASEANIRTGPSVRYPIQWIYKRKHWPVEVTATFEQWLRVRDQDGEEGWVHEQLVSGRRYGVIDGEAIVKIYRLPLANAAPILLAEKGVVAPISTCKDNWCKIEIAGQEGWVESKYLWGVYRGESID